MSGPPLTNETDRRVRLMFPPEEQDLVRTLLLEECGNNLPMLRNVDSVAMERIRFAALKLSRGDLNALDKALKLACTDWRDFLVAADFANDLEAHKSWQP